MNLRVSTLFAAGLMMAGCASAGKHVYVASDTTLGVIGAMNTAQTSGKLIIGYDRQFIAVVPKKQTGTDTAVISTQPASATTAADTATTTTDAEAGAAPPARSGDAMSAYNCTHITIKRITVRKFYEYLATGPAAIALVSKLPARNRGSECSYKSHADDAD